MFTPIIPQEQISGFDDFIGRHDHLVIVSHQGPDGDSVGSSLGMYFYLKALGKEDVRVIVPNEYPTFLRWMNGIDQVRIYEYEKEACDAILAQADLILCLDFNGFHRVGGMAQALRESCAAKVLVDHHLDPEPTFDLAISYPHLSSTCELVFRLITRLDGFDLIDLRCAEALYTGMMTDTGGFTFNSNDASLFRIVAHLLDKGVDKDRIYAQVYNTSTASRLRLTGYLLSEKMTVYPEYATAIISINEEEMKRFDFQKGDAEGVVNMPLSIGGIIFSVFVREDTYNKIVRLSLRSVGSFACNQFASTEFCGGGHLNASGAESELPMEETLEKIVALLPKYKNKLLASLNDYYNRAH